MGGFIAAVVTHALKQDNWPQAGISKRYERTYIDDGDCSSISVVEFKGSGAVGSEDVCS